MNRTNRLNGTPMLKQTLSIAIMASCISGCAMLTPKPITHEIHTDVMPILANLSSKIDQQDQTILEQIKADKLESHAQVEKLITDIKVLTKKVNQINHEKHSPKLIPVPSKCAETLGDKFLLGQIESVYIDELKTNFDTRIDTGAESSSIDARNVVLFERDGNQWVRFDVHVQGDKQPAKTFEAKVVRFVHIKKAVENSADRRPVIRAHLKIGRYTAETDLNLTDRSHLDYPLLLGRKFMKDIAIVDVSKKYIHGRAPVPTASKKQDKK